MKRDSNYEIVIIDGTARVPGEDMGHMIGMETAAYCADQRHSTLLVVGSFSHILKQQRSAQSGVVKTEDGYDILFIPTNSYSSHLGFKRLLWFLTFAFGVFNKLRIISGAKVISLSTPMPFLDVLVPLLKLATKAKVVVLIRDLWPEHFQSVEGAGRRLIFCLATGPIRWMRAVMLRYADATASVSSLGVGLATAANPGAPHLLLPNVTVSCSDFRPDELLDRSYFCGPEQLLLNYSGTMGDGYDVELLIRAVAQINQETNGRIKLVISGAGPQFHSLQSRIKSIGNNHIQMVGLIPWREYRSLVFNSDLSVLPYKLGSSVDFPAKFYDYLVAGTPVLHSLPGELKSFTDQHRCGFYYQASNFDSILEALRVVISNLPELNGARENASRLGPRFEKEIQLKEFLKLYTGGFFNEK